MIQHCKPMATWAFWRSPDCILGKDGPKVEIAPD